MVLKETILIVDNEKNSLNTVLDQLQKAGYSTLQAQTCGQALKIVKESKPDLVLIDANLPEMSGLEVCRKNLEVNELAPSVILVVDEKNDSDILEEGFNVEADDYLIRPVSTWELLARIRTVLHLRKAEKALHESENRFRTIYENLPMGYQSMDINGNLIDVNQAWLRIMGFERDEVIGNWFGDYLTPGDKEKFKNRFPLFKAKGEIKDSGFEMVRKDGSQIFTSFDGKIGYDSQMRFNQTHCVLTDVTDRKKAELALSDSEKRFRSIYDSVPISIWEEDFTTVYDMLQDLRKSGVKDLRKYIQSHPEFPKQAIRSVIIKDVNDITLSIFKAESKEALKQNMVIYFPDGDTSPFEKELIAIWERRSFFEIERIHETLAGEKIIVHIALNIPITRDEFSRILVLKTDITERKKIEMALKASEEQFRMVFESSNVGKSLTMPSGEVRANKALADMLGYTQEELAEKTWQMITPPEDVPSIQTKLGPLLKGESDSVRFNKKYIHKNGSIIWVDLSTKIRRDEEGRPLHFITTAVDITERKKAEEALWELQRRLMTLMSNLPGMAYSCKADDDWTMKFVSDGCYELTGYRPEELNNNSQISYKSLIHPDDLKEVQDSYVGAGKKSFQLTYRINTADGQVKWVWEQGQGIAGSDGSIQTYEGFITDITQNKNAEEALQQSHDLVSSFIKNSPIYAYLKDVTPEQSRVVFASENFIDMIGIPGSQMAGKKMEELFPPTFAAKMTAEDWSVIQKGEVLQIEEELNGRSYITIKYPIQFGTRSVLAGYTVDITDLKHTENQLKELTSRQEAILGSIPDILMEMDENKIYHWANPAGFEFFGPDVIGHHAMDYLAAEQMADEKLQRMYDGDENKVYSESKVQRNDGEIRLLAWWSRVIRDEQNRAIGCLSTARDITEERLVQEEITALNTRLEQRVEERTRELQDAQEKIVRQEKLATLGQLAGSVGHELRNPLGVISNAIYYLKMINFDSDEKNKNYLSMIETETHNAEKIISDLLEFSRTKSVDREEVKVIDLINKSLRRRATPLNINITVKVSDSLPTVLADPHHIEQILENLIVNAYQAMPDSGTLGITAREIPKDKKTYVAISVKDSGSGITQENMAKLFEPLFTTKPKGIGLGLAVCRRLAEINEGFIEVKSEPGKGAEFILKLPAAGGK